MAVSDAYVFPGFLTPVLTQLSFQSHRLLFSHASANVGGENTPGIDWACGADGGRGWGRGEYSSLLVKAVGLFLSMICWKCSLNHVYSFTEQFWEFPDAQGRLALENTSTRKEKMLITPISSNPQSIFKIPSLYSDLSHILAKGG